MRKGKEGWDEKCGKMIEIKPSSDGTYALVVKGVVWIIMIWTLLSILYLFVRTYFGYVEIIEGTTNSFLISILFFLSLGITAVSLLVVGKIKEGSIAVRISEDGITLRRGVIIKKEEKIPLDELREASVMPESLNFIDQIFNVGTVLLEGKKLIVVNGVKKPSLAANSVNDLLKSIKRKGITIESLMKEVKELRDELEEIKKKIEGKKPKIKKGKEEKKFEIKPLEEEL